MKNIVAVVYAFVMIFTHSPRSSVSGSNTIMDVLNAHSDRFKVLIRALGHSGVGDTLKKQTGPFTLFAPTNDAFKALPDALKSKFRDDMKRSLMGHIVAGLQSMDKLTDGADLTSLNGINYNIAVADTVVTIGSSAKILADGEYTADNGMIYAIDGLLTPRV